MMFQRVNGKRKAAGMAGMSMLSALCMLSALSSLVLSCSALGAIVSTPVSSTPNQVTVSYDWTTGRVQVDTGGAAVTALEIIAPDLRPFRGTRPSWLTGPFDVFREDKLFLFRPNGVTGPLDLGPVMAASWELSPLLQGISVRVARAPSGELPAVFHDAARWPFDCDGNRRLEVLDANCLSASQLPNFLAEQRLPWGDVNGDRTVNVSDYAVLAENIGRATQYTGGDLSGDRRVSLADLLVLGRHFGESTLLTSDASVRLIPEPINAGLFLLGGWLLSVAHTRSRIGYSLQQ